MGGSSYDSGITRQLIASTPADDIMSHSANIRIGRVPWAIHPLLDPKQRNRAGQIIRESRDSAAHPNSVGCALFFDTTGSMGRIPGRIIKHLPNLMDLITRNGYLTDPQMMFGAVNDATTHCAAPLEVGQFESGNEMDDVFTKIFVDQNGGGGTGEESYDLIFYFLARKAVLDCVEKRNKKGYLFVVGDERPRKFVSKDEVQRVIGDTLEDDIPIQHILAEVRQKFEVFWLYPSHGAEAGNTLIQRTLRNLFGERLLQLDNEDEICSAVAAAIAINEGRDPRTVMTELQSGLGASSQAMVDQIAASVPPRRFDDSI